MASGMMPNGGGNEGSRRLGNSKVYSRKSFKGAKNSRKRRFDMGVDEPLSLIGGSGEETGFLGQKVTIDLSMKKKGEVRELRRKLEGELNLVRSLVRKIETKDWSKNGNGGGMKRVHSDLGSRNLNQLSVSLSENNQSVGENVEKEKRTPKANKFYKNNDFLLGKDKIPIVESNKKSKGNARKGGATEEEDGVGLGKFPKQTLKSCSALLERLIKHKHGWVFKTPVDTVALGLHDYYDIIKHPMDLGTVKSRLADNYYKSPIEFAEDVKRTFQNAMTYNPEGQDVYLMAAELLKIFEEKWAVIEADYLRGLKVPIDRGDGIPTPISRKIARPPPPPKETTRALDKSRSIIQKGDSKRKAINLAPSSRTPNPKKPKANVRNKREMTYEEKQKLSASLQDLPSEKLENVVDIIKKKNPSLCQNDEEIEVDIDIVDTETLWELDRFVTNHKKSSSKNKKKAEPELSPPARPEETEQNVQKQNLAPMVTETPKEKNPEENLLSSTPTQLDEQGDNAGRSSNASSSSTDSGSSSSDSDNESSL